MFNEVLNIKPRLSAGDTAKMERTLTQRFTKVAKTFSKSLKNAVKGSVLGIGLAFLAELINPLQELEERIKNMLEKGDDANERAAKFGTTPGALNAFERLAAAEGLDREKFDKLLESFASSVEAAKTELDEIAKDPTKEKSAATAAVERFIPNPDQADGFFKFLQGLKKFGDQSGLAQRQKVEKAVFGERLYGNSRRLLESNLPESLTKLKGPGQAEVTTGVTKLADLNRRATARTALNETTNMIGTAKRLTPGIVDQIGAREAAEQQRERAQIADYAKLVKAAEAVQSIADFVKEIKGLVFDALGVLRDIQKWTANFFPSIPSLPGIGKAWLKWVGGDGMPAPVNKGK